MRKLLVDEKQVFGSVKNEITVPGQGKPAEMLSKPLGAETVRPNNGLDHGPSFADKNPGAQAQACAGGYTPLTTWTGKPKGAA